MPMQLIVQFQDALAAPDQGAASATILVEDTLMQSSVLSRSCAPTQGAQGVDIKFPLLNSTIDTSTLIHAARGKIDVSNVNASRQCMKQVNELSKSMEHLWKRSIPLCIWGAH